MKLGSKGEHRLQEKYDTTNRANTFYDAHMRNHLNEQMIQLIQYQTMVFIATADARGHCDCSPRFGPAGFVRVLDNQTVLYPEYAGNGVMASLGNISENPHIGMVFVDFFDTTTGLHINGEAHVLENDQLLKNPETPSNILDAIRCFESKKAERWVSVNIHEAYIHCSKNIPLLQRKKKISTMQLL